MNVTPLKKNMTSKVLVFALLFLPLLGLFASSAEARDHHRGRGNRHAYRQYHRHGGRGYYRHRGYAERRHHGYWRRYHGRRYWYENGGYYASPGGLSISIGL